MVNTRAFVAVMAVMAVMSAGLVMIISADDPSATITTGSAGTNATWTFDDVTKVMTISGTGVILNFNEHDGLGLLNPIAETIVIEDGITRIGRYAFAYTRELTSITIPGSVTLINEGAFKMCTSLTSITIPGSVTTIRSDTFKDCESLATAYVPNGTSLGANAFPTSTNVIRYDPLVEITSTQNDVSMITGTNFSYNVMTVPADATISVSGASWLNVNGHLIYGTPATAGDYEITVSAYKGGYETGTQTFTIHVVSSLAFTSGPSSGYIVQVG